VAQYRLLGLLRITGGAFRLPNRLLTQMERITVVEAARKSLVIGQV
jgi:hypothetical protein